VKRMKPWRHGAILLAALAAGTGAQGFNHWDPSKPELAPKTLTATGMYADIATGKVRSDVHFFEVNSPLWTDGAHKQRWVVLKAGTSIGFKEKDDYYDYPDGAVFIKEFALDTVAGDSRSRIRWETRLLVNRKENQDPSRPDVLVDRWYGFSYKWRKDQKDADLLADTGFKASVRTWPEGLGKPSRMKKWSFPSRDMCLQCHRTEQGMDLHGRSVLGFFTAQLNRPSSRDPAVNQLDELFRLKVLSGVRPPFFDRSPRWLGLDDKVEGKDANSFEVLEMKSRAYIAANCSGCHGTRGLEVGAVFGVNHNFDFHTGSPAMRMQYTSVSWDFGLSEVAPRVENAVEESLWGVYLLTPRFAQKSVILFRQKQRNTAPPEDITAFDPDRNQMPPMGSFEVDQKAVKVIGAWIEAFPARTPVSSRLRPFAAREVPLLQGRRLRIPASLLTGRAEVTLVGLDGRKAPLTRLGEGDYAVDASVPRGVYVLRVGSEKYTRSLW
jgi:hypothetical protein